MIERNCKKILRLLFFLLLVNAYSVSAQQPDVDVATLKNIEVDQLSDDQIRKFIEEMDKRGISESQLEVLAKSRGISASKVQKLRIRIREVRNSTEQTSGAIELNRIRESQIQAVDKPLQEEDDLFSVLGEEEEEIDPEEKIFGLDLFRTENLTFQPSTNIPTPKNYQLGAGDNIIIDIWGTSERTYQLTVSPEGAIRIPNLGPIYVSGLDVEEASQKIRSRLKRIYSNLGVNAYADISLGQLRTINVNIVGEVTNQGTYTMSSFANVFNALYYAGGPNKNGSLRIIDHFRNGRKIATVDIYDFLFNGKVSNSSLNDQDLIIVRPFAKRVQITGAVKRPGYYEVVDGESLAQLLNYAGGFTSNAYRKTISVKRNRDLRRGVETVGQEEFSSFELTAGDEIMVTQIMDRFENRLQIAGAVNKPGEYEFSEGMMLKDLIRKAEGLREDAFRKRGTIIRLNDDLTLSSIPFNLNRVMQGNDIALQNEDYVEIRSIFELRDEFVVQIEGEIRDPGQYAYVDSLTVESLIMRAGGFKETAARSIVEVARRKAFDDSSDPSMSAEIFNFSISDDLSLSAESSDFVLRPYDLVIVRKSPFYDKQSLVEIQGEANFPGKYAIEKKNERISDLLARAGGLTNFAYVKGATLIRRTEYYSDDFSETAKLKRENIQELAERDTALSVNDVKIKEQESIGIDLEQIIKNPGSSYDLILKEGDILGIPKLLQTVRLRGELLYPSTVRYDKTKSFKNYISQAGGFSDKAKRGKSYVLYANGSVQRTRRYFWINVYPNVEPGAEVIVPERPERRKISPSEVVGLTTGVATFGLIVIRIVDLMEASQQDDDDGQ